MARPAQQLLTRPQLKALILKTNHLNITNGEIAKIAGVSKETIRLWFDEPNGKTLPAKCWRTYKLTGDIFEPPTFKTAAERRQHKANKNQMREFDKRVKEIEKLRLIMRPFLLSTACWQKKVWFLRTRAHKRTTTTGKNRQKPYKPLSLFLQSRA